MTDDIPMIYHGQVKQGVVVFDGPAPAEGAEVSVEVVEPVSPEVVELRKVLLEFAGCVKDLPADFARNHDHYIHGARKR